MSLEWHGDEISELLERALVVGIDKTTSEGAIEAKRLVNVDTATLQGSIRPEPAKLNEDEQVEGCYGPHDVAYAIPQEFLPGEWMPSRDGEGEEMRKRRGGKPYMRPSAAAAEGKLPDNLAQAYKDIVG